MVAGAPSRHVSAALGYMISSIWRPATLDTGYAAGGSPPLDSAWFECSVTCHCLVLATICTQRR
jgi:hypothetical protein